MIAMLIVFVALVQLANACSALLPDVGGDPITLQRDAGPAHGAGVLADRHPLGEAPTAGALMGIKTVLNEFIAYLELARCRPTRSIRARG